MAEPMPGSDGNSFECQCKNPDMYKKDLNGTCVFASCYKDGNPKYGLKEGHIAVANEEKCECEAGFKSTGKIAAADDWCIRDCGPNMIDVNSKCVCDDTNNYIPNA